MRVVRLEQKGRGRALRAVWSASDADVLAYMDVDLSTDLDALLPLVAPLLSGHSDLAIGSRLARGLARRARPEARGDLARATTCCCARPCTRGSPTRSAASRRSAPTSRARLLPLVEDTGWFFDTELLVLAERSGLRIHEVPGGLGRRPRQPGRPRRAPPSPTCAASPRLGRALATGRLPLAEVRARARRAAARGVRGSGSSRFARVGVASTVAYLVLYLLLRAVLPARGGERASRCSLTAVANTAANRRFTFGVAGRAGAVRHQRTAWRCSPPASR